jgi:predicted GNAT superfamily acetyltransferase
VFAAGKFRDDAAVVGVDELRGDYVREDLVAVADDGGGGLVAGAFDAENEAVGHSRECRSPHRANYARWGPR